MTGCPETHAHKDLELSRGRRKGETAWVPGSNMTLFERRREGARWVGYFAKCNTCGEVSLSVPRQWFLSWRTQGVPTTEQTFPDNGEADMHPCSYAGCPNRDIEWHHFAPRGVFTTDAENWPVMPLCLKHHQEWHQMIIEHNVWSALKEDPEVDISIMKLPW